MPAVFAGEVKYTPSRSGLDASALPSSAASRMRRSRRRSSALWVSSRKLRPRSMAPSIEGIAEADLDSRVNGGVRAARWRRCWRGHLARRPRRVAPARYQERPHPAPDGSGRDLIDEGDARFDPAKRGAGVVVDFLHFGTYKAVACCCRPKTDHLSGWIPAEI